MGQEIGNELDEQNAFPLCGNVMKLARALYTDGKHASLLGLRVIDIPGRVGSSSVINTRRQGKKVREDLCSGLGLTNVVGERLICKPQQDGLGEVES
ncbi:hypothetical protein MC885_015085 [Smutsia gigantea]|nr:hypothetical protein MC885_015085 [Smutsia gigantea]